MQHGTDAIVSVDLDQAARDSARRRQDALPLIDMRGRIIGIDAAAARSSRGVAVESVRFAIPIDRAMAIVNVLGGPN